jgi:excisionase family DNA binding protein
MVRNSNFMDVLAARMANLHKGRKPTPTRVRPAPAAPAPSDPSSSLTLAEAAALARVSKPTLRSWNIPSYKVGRIVRIRRADFDRFIEQHSTGAHDTGMQKESC